MRRTPEVLPPVRGLGRMLAGADRVGSAGVGPVLGTALAAEPAGDAVAGRVEGAGLLPAHRSGERLRRTGTGMPIAPCAICWGPTGCQRHAVPLPGQAGGAQARVLLASEVLPPVRGLEVLPPVRRTPEVLPPVRSNSNTAALSGSGSWTAASPPKQPWRPCARVTRPCATWWAPPRAA